jgi:hypothetical protein
VTGPIRIVDPQTGSLAVTVVENLTTPGVAAWNVKRNVCELPTASVTGLPGTGPLGGPTPPSPAASGGRGKTLFSVRTPVLVTVTDTEMNCPTHNGDGPLVIDAVADPTAWIATCPPATLRTLALVHAEAVAVRLNRTVPMPVARKIHVNTCVDPGAIVAIAGSGPLMGEMRFPPPVVVSVGKTACNSSLPVLVTVR